MTMAEHVDARGLSCPIPVMLTRRKIEAMTTGILEVLVDTDTARENVTRLAEREGWAIEVQENAEGYRLLLKKG